MPSDDDRYVVTQWGSRARKFSSYAPEERRTLLQRCSAILDRINGELDVVAFISYGALLGAVRGGALIGHDFDIDAVFMPASGRREDLIGAVEAIVAFLAENGFSVGAESNGQIKAEFTDRGNAFTLEFFAGWVEGTRFFQYFALRDAPIGDAVLPLSRIEIEGVDFAAPAQPERLVAAIYGPGWRVPDPHFRYALTAEDWKPFAFLFTRQRRNFWESYYEQSSRNAVWVEYPSQFAVFAASSLPRGARILELGCGNGRDGLFLARSGFAVTMADYSDIAIRNCLERARGEGLSIEATTLDVGDLAGIRNFVRRQEAAFDAVYARFFLHAIDRSAAINVLKIAAALLKRDGRVFLEYRALPPPGAAAPIYENGEHYRRLVPQDELEADAKAVGFAVEYAVQGHGMAKYRAEDPLIGRTVLCRP